MKDSSEIIADKTPGPLKRRILKSIKRLPPSEKSVLVKTSFFKALYPDESIVNHERANDILTFQSKNSQMVFNL